MTKKGHHKILWTNQHFLKKGHQKEFFRGKWEGNSF